MIGSFLIGNRRKEEITAREELIKKINNNNFTLDQISYFFNFVSDKVLPKDEVEPYKELFRGNLDPYKFVLVNLLKHDDRISVKDYSDFSKILDKIQKTEISQQNADKIEGNNNHSNKFQPHSGELQSPNQHCLAFDSSTVSRGKYVFVAIFKASLDYSKKELPINDIESVLIDGRRYFHAGPKSDEEKLNAEGFSETELDLQGNWCALYCFKPVGNTKPFEKGATPSELREGIKKLIERNMSARKLGFISLEGLKRTGLEFSSNVG